MSKPWQNNMLENTAKLVCGDEDINSVKHFIERYGESCHEKGREDAISDALAILKNQHMIRTYEDDFNAKIEVPFYRTVYEKIKEQKNDT